MAEAKGLKAGRLKLDSPQTTTMRLADNHMLPKGFVSIQDGLGNNANLKCSYTIVHLKTTEHMRNIRCFVDLPLLVPHEFPFKDLDLTWVQTPKKSYCTTEAGKSSTIISITRLSRALISYKLRWKQPDLV